MCTWCSSTPDEWYRQWPCILVNEEMKGRKSSTAWWFLLVFAVHRHVWLSMRPPGHCERRPPYVADVSPLLLLAFQFFQLNHFCNCVILFYFTFQPYNENNWFSGSELDCSSGTGNLCRFCFLVWWVFEDCPLVLQEDADCAPLLAIDAMLCTRSSDVLAPKRSQLSPETVFMQLIREICGKTGTSFKLTWEIY